jgi:hypothetical protein
MKSIAVRKAYLNEHPVDFPLNNLEGLGPIVIQACLMEAGKILRISASGVGSF